MTRDDACDALLYFFGHIARVKDKKWENPSYPSYVSSAPPIHSPYVASLTPLRGQK